MHLGERQERGRHRGRSSKRSSNAFRRRRATSTACAALVFNAQFDAYRGVVSYVRVVDGRLSPGMRFVSMAHERVFECTEVGIFAPEMRATKSLELGDVGYAIANIKSLGDIDVGDTITSANDPAHVALAGYRKAVPMVYCGLYPNEGVTTTASATRWRSSSSTTRRSSTNPRRRSRSASGFVAVSWACSTWRSSRNGSSATTGSI